MPFYLIKTYLLDIQLCSKLFLNLRILELNTKRLSKFDTVLVNTHGYA